MSLEAIKQVNLAEENAKALKAQAIQDAKKLVADAESNGLQTLEKARYDAQQKNELALEQAEENAKLHYKKVIRDTEGTCDQLRAEAQVRLDKAIDLIVRRVVDS